MKYINIILFAGMLAINYLANTLPLNNKTTGAISDSFPNLFVPAGITFSIWGVIYLLLLAFTVIQFRPSGSEISKVIENAFAITCIMNGLWIVFWHYGKLPLSLLVMLCLLVALIWINMQIRDLPFGLIKAAFGIYLGWICIATIANVTALLVHYDWRGFGLTEETWTIIMISTGIIIAALSILDLRNPFIALSVIWAFAGIILKRHYDYRSIVLSAATGILLLSIVMIYSFFRKYPAAG
jgi:hypothetical protein